MICTRESIYNFETRDGRSILVQLKQSVVWNDVWLKWKYVYIVYMMISAYIPEGIKDRLLKASLDGSVLVSK